MKIKNIIVRNYRKLYNISLDLDESVTLVVGRNNSGKTSLSELFDKFFGKSLASFNMNDFSFACYKDYENALLKYQEYNTLIENDEEEEVCLNKLDEAKAAIPSITLEVYLEYEESDDDNIGSFSELNLNLDETRRDINISCDYYIAEKEKFLKLMDKELKDLYNNKIEDLLEQNHSSFYRVEYFAFDKNRKNVERKPVKKDQIANAFILNLINAQRDLDDYSHDKKGRVAKAMSSFLDSSSIHEENIKELENKLQDLAKKIEDVDFKNIYGEILSDLDKFGISNNESSIIMRALFDAKNILKISNNFLYNIEGRCLPESYNGLGFSNLTIIMLQIIIYCSLFETKPTQSLSHILFIEEPEAHLHPQMQMVFIRKIREYIKEKEWNVQIIITTHSSQILTDCDFKSVRYFDISKKHQVDVRSMNTFISIQNKEAKTDEKRLAGLRFLQTYMNLGVCNLFFADKIIMIEGTTERLLLPKLIKNDDVLSCQYISLMEVGGAYAHIFKNLIEFINVRTLIVTDIDSVSKVDGKACATEEKDAKTRNPILASWLPNKKLISDLLSCKNEEKEHSIFKVSYQIPENIGERCGRSFEESFFLANANLLVGSEDGIVLKEIFSSYTDENQIKLDAYNITSKKSFNSKKTSIAYDIIQSDKWKMPKYILEGLDWLKQN